MQDSGDFTTEEVSASPKPLRKRVRKKSLKPQTATVPLETVLALKQQLEELEKSYQEELASQQAVMKKLKQKLKKEKAKAKTNVTSESVPATKEDGPEVLKKANLEILQLRDELETKEKQFSKMRQSLRAAQSELENVRKATPSMKEPSTPQLLNVSVGGMMETSDEVGFLDNQSVLDLSSRRNNLSSKVVVDLCNRIKISTALLSINLSRTKVGAKSAAALGQALRSQGTVQSLTLERCSLTDASITQLADGMRGNRCITVLSLKGNRMSTSGSKALAAVIAEHPTLASLDVSLCGMKSDHCVVIATAACLAPILNYVSLSGNEVGVAGAKALANGIAESKITSLDVDACQIADEGVVALLESIRKSRVTHLNLSRNPCGSKAVASVLGSVVGSASSKLVEVVLIGCGLSDEACAQLGAALKSSPSLRHLSLWGAHMDAQANAAFRDGLSASVLAFLDLRGTGLGAAGLKNLAQGLKGAAALETLDVSGNNLGAEGGGILGEIISKSKSVTVLFANGNNFGNEGIRSLFAALEQNRVLKELSVELNMIDDGGMPAAARLLGSSNAIVSINFGFNHIGPAGIRELTPFLGKLESLSLESNNVGGEGAQLLEDSAQQLKYLNLSLNNLRHEGARAIARLIQKCALAKLDLRKNGFDNDGVIAISASLRLNQTLTSLDLSENRISERGATSLAETLQLSRQLKMLLLCSNPLGDEGERKLRAAMTTQKTVILSE